MCWLGHGLQTLASTGVLQNVSGPTENTRYKDYVCRGMIWRSEDNLWESKLSIGF